MDKTKKAIFGGLITALLLAGCGTSAQESLDPQATPSASVSATASATASAEPLVTPTPPPNAPVVTPSGQLVTVRAVIDGDTIDTSVGRVRLSGIDTPERGECNYQAAANELRAVLAASNNQVYLVSAGSEDQDRYGRLLRYVDTSTGVDANLHLIAAGLAIARYDSTDGYGFHPRERQYQQVDRQTPAAACQDGKAGAAQASSGTGQVAAGTGALDPRFTSCAKAKAAGYGPYDSSRPEYGWYNDGDADGIACE